MPETQPVCEQGVDHCLLNKMESLPDEAKENQSVIEQMTAPAPLLPNPKFRFIPILPSILNKEALFSLLDEPHRFVASGVTVLTSDLDEFFSDEKVLYGSSGSYIRITGDTVLNEGGVTGFVGDVKISVALPNTQKKAKLLFESNPDEARGELDQQQQNTPVSAVQSKNYFAGLEAILAEYEHWRFHHGAGVKLSSGLDFFLRVRADRVYDISEQWQAYVNDTLFWFYATGYSFKSNLEFDRKIDENFLFRSSAFAGWKEENMYWDLSQEFSLIQSISKDQALIYMAGVYGLSEPTVIASNYVLQLRYRKQLHSDYLFIEYIPKISYQRDFDFEPNVSFTVRLEMVFNG